MSIDAGAQVAIILLACGPCVVIVNLLGQVCTLDRAPRTKETLPDFHEGCWVTRHPRIFCRLTGCQRIPRFWGVTDDNNEDTALSSAFQQNKDMCYGLSYTPLE